MVGYFFLRKQILSIKPISPIFYSEYRQNTIFFAEHNSDTAITHVCILKTSGEICMFFSHKGNRTKQRIESL